MNSHFRFNALFWLLSITMNLTDSIISYGEYDIDLRRFGLRLLFRNTIHADVEASLNNVRLAWNYPNRSLQFTCHDYWDK